MQDRADRPLGDHRTRTVQAFVELLRSRGSHTMLEVGCGAGRDGQLLASEPLSYAGVDLSRVSVTMCRALGLDAIEASATSLPFDTDSFDAAWSMSTMMHLPGPGFGEAVSELQRVVRAGGVVEIGVWGHTKSREWTSPDGRYFNHRSDDDLKRELQPLGQLTGFDTWDWFEGGGHYQWARVEVL